jgi:hypothetical protein
MHDVCCMIRTVSQWVARYFNVDVWRSQRAYYGSMSDDSSIFAALCMLRMGKPSSIVSMVSRRV